MKGKKNKMLGLIQRVKITSDKNVKLPANLEALRGRELTPGVQTAESWVQSKFAVKVGPRESVKPKPEVTKKSTGK